MSERHFIDASIGPTFGCLVGIQYYHLKFGDRYYYEHGDQSGSFTIGLLLNKKHLIPMRNNQNHYTILPPWFSRRFAYNDVGKNQ